MGDRALASMRLMSRPVALAKLYQILEVLLDAYDI